MKSMDVPLATIGALKKSPMDIIRMAEERENGVYILNRNRSVGVVMTAAQYDSLIRKIEQMEEEITVLPRLAAENKLLSDEEVRGDQAREAVVETGEDDGWE